MFEKLKLFNPFSSKKSLSHNSIKDIVDEYAPSAPKSTRGKEIPLEKIIKEGYKTNSDVYAVINKIINKSVDIPLNLYEVKKDGSKELVNDSRLLELIENPNEKQDKIDFLTEAIGFLLLSGNCIIEKIYSTGFDYPIEMKVLETQNIEINQDQTKYKYTDPISGISSSIDSERIIHIRYFSPDSVNASSGLAQSPLQAGFMTLDAGNDLREADQFALKNRGISGILTNDSDNTTLSQSQQIEIQRVANQKFGNPTSFNKMLVSSAKLRHIPIGIDGGTIKLLESGKVKLRDICNIFSVDSSLFNDPDNKTYSNRKEAEKALYTEAIQPVLNRLLRPLNRELVSVFEAKEKKDYILKADFSGVESLQSDQKIEAEKDKIVTDSLIALTTSALSTSQKKYILINEFDFTEIEAEDYLSPSEEELLIAESLKNQEELAKNLLS